MLLNMDRKTFLTHRKCAVESFTKMSNLITLMEVAIMNMRHLHRYFFKLIINKAIGYFAKKKPF